MAAVDACIQFGERQEGGEHAETLEFTFYSFNNSLATLTHEMWLAQFPD